VLRNAALGQEAQDFLGEQRVAFGLFRYQPNERLWRGSTTSRAWTRRS
jgi:hypothetical protein